MQGFGQGQFHAAKDERRNDRVDQCRNHDPARPDRVLPVEQLEVAYAGVLLLEQAAHGIEQHEQAKHQNGHRRGKEGQQDCPAVTIGVLLVRRATAYAHGQ